MQIIRRPNTMLCPEGTAITIGNFDGVHLGHQSLIQTVKDKAQSLGIKSMVISFEPMPTEYFSDSHQRIYPLRDKIKAIQHCNVDYFYCIPFDVNFAQLSCDDFVNKVLIDTLNSQFCTVGDDFRFGRNRQGDVNKLAEIFSSKDLAFEISPTIINKTLSDPKPANKGTRVSSSLIRQHLAEGDVEQANKLLGRPYCLSGRVRHGDKLGRTLGFPTANIRTSENIALKHGVYLVEATHNNKTYYGACNLGRRPTFNGVELRLETTLFDFDHSIYGDEVELRFIEFVRSDRKFGDQQSLITQIQKDIEACQAIIKNL